MKPTRTLTTALVAVLFILHHSQNAGTFAQQPIVDQSVVFAEEDGLIAVEAEHFFKQTSADVRAFHLTHSKLTPATSPDGDPNHVAGASGGAYLEILPDTRRTHDDKLIKGENFSPDPGKMAVLHYKVHISTPGRYFVWVRAHSTGPEDNGLHVGLDGDWPASGQRLNGAKEKKRGGGKASSERKKNTSVSRSKIFWTLRKQVNTSFNSQCGKMVSSSISG